MYTCREERYPARRPSSSAHGQPISINPVSDQIGARSERIYAASDRIYTSGSLRPTCPLARGGKLYPRIGSNREKFRFSQVFFVFRIFGRGGEGGRARELQGKRGRGGFVGWARERISSRSGEFYSGRRPLLYRFPARVLLLHAKT